MTMFGKIAVLVILATSVASSVVPVNVALEPCTEVDKLIPDPKNCSRFYECTLNGWVGFFCYPGLEFNPATSRCDFPENVQCATELNSREVTLEPCQQVDQLKPDVKNCSRFYECTLSGWVGEACNPGLEFNPQTLQCDYPQNVKCANETAQNNVGLEPCIELDKLIPDPKNCSRFYECTLDGWVGLFCYPGLEFNPATSQCDYPENVQCGTELKPNEIMLEPCNQVDQLKPDVKNCSRFYECTLSGWVGEACNPGLEFNPQTLQCDYPQNVKCANETAQNKSEEPTCNPLNLGKLFPDPIHRDRFLECFPQGLISMPCPKGLLFNPETGLCDFSRNVK